MKKYIFIFLIQLFYFNQANAIPVGFDATVGTWAVSATDDSGLNWDGSTLTFESQTADGNNFLLEGHFNWIGSNGAFGRENFTGTLFFDNTIELSGFELVPPTSGIAVYDYFALLADNGTEIINGSWDGPILSDDWSATLQITSVPVPAAVWLFGSGLIGLVGMRKKSKVPTFSA